MRSFNITLLVFAIITVHLSKSARILGIFHATSFSHYILGNALMKGLATKGHDVTIIAAFEEKNPPPNYKQIVLTGLVEEAKKIVNMADMYEQSQANLFVTSIMITKKFQLISEKVLQDQKVQNLIHSNETFDVVIVEHFMNEAHKAFAHCFKAPLVVFSTVNTNYFIDPLVGNPSPLAYIPNLFLSYGSKMSFIERLHNVIFSCFVQLMYYYYNCPDEEKIMRKYFPNPPAFLNDQRYNVSLVLLNSHPSINQPVPNVPNMINIGGFHVEPANKLGQDLQKFLGGATNGAVLFSMGSNLKSTAMSADKRNAILASFAKLKEKVLMKWEDDDLLNRPSNVKLSRWLPQQDVLAHPNVKLFITHGGLLSTTETIYHGVPILIIPIFGDQKLNAAAAENSGYGLSVPYADLSEEKLSIALNELLRKPKYRDNAQKRSRLLRDRPLHPLDEAIYWVEYVARHKGAPHLRVAGVDLAWHSYFLLDVFGFILLIVLVLIIISRKILKLLLRSNKSQKFKDKKQ